jgi:hypothetical protein
MRTRVRSTIEIFSPNCPRCRSPRVQLGYESTSLSERVFGLNELLCNNCGLTFKGFAVPGTVKRAPSEKKELAGNRQLAPRYKVKFPVSMTIPDTDPFGLDPKGPPRLEGVTRDISRIGLAVVVADVQRAGYNFSSTMHRLIVHVSLPNGGVELRAAPVRHERPNLQKAGAGWVIGLRIIKMGDRDCSRWLAYLDSLAP